MNTAVKGIIFDLDGTLADTMDDLTTAMNMMLSAKGYRNLSRTELIQNINRGAREFVRRSMPEEYRENDALIAECMEIYFDSYRKCYTDKTRLYDGIAESVSHLYKMGVKLGVLSNKQDEQVQQLIRKLFPAGEFAAVMGQSEFPHKPDPTSALYIADKLGVRPENMMLVGDSNIDMQTACNAGMYPAGVSWGYRSIDILLEAGAKKIFHSPFEIIDICK